MHLLILRAVLDVLDRAASDGAADEAGLSFEHGLLTCPPGFAAPVDLSAVSSKALGSSFFLPPDQNIVEGFISIEQAAAMDTRPPERLLLR